MDKITAIIIDDELFARENLLMLLNEYCPEIDVIGMGENVEDARSLIKEKKPEAVFLDIRMPSGEEGLELLDDVQKEKFQIVFVTAFKDYAIKAFNANAIHYILKPIDIEDLKEAVDKLKQYKEMFNEDDHNLQTYIESIKNFSDNIHYQEESNKITITHLRGIKIIEDSSILYIEGEGNCSSLHFIDGASFLDTRTLKVYDEILNSKKFYRIHKKYIINLEELTDYIHQDGYFAKLKNGIKLPVARVRVADFIQKIKSL
ncbi:MAG: response regulator transcription factor [Flavobacteriales bacterium]|nr:response regulator transcription factor [Flavobacteriales bacterium]